jgi:hypothetical protein
MKDRPHSYRGKNLGIFGLIGLNGIPGFPGGVLPFASPAKRGEIEKETTI